MWGLSSALVSLSSSNKSIHSPEVKINIESEDDVWHPMRLGNDDDNNNNNVTHATL